MAPGPPATGGKEAVAPPPKTTARRIELGPNADRPFVVTHPMPTDPHRPGTVPGPPSPASRNARASTRLTPSTKATGGSGRSAGRMGAHVRVSTYGETSSSEAGVGPDSSNEAPYSGLHASTH